MISLENRIGQAQFNILRQKGLDSVCWRNAAMSIDADCETMAHSRKQRLAIQLSNCHLQVHNTPTDFVSMCIASAYQRIAADERSRSGRSITAAV